jgi:hypothetical protein
MMVYYMDSVKNIGMDKNFWKGIIVMDREVVLLLRTEFNKIIIMGLL